MGSGRSQPANPQPAPMQAAPSGYPVAGTHHPSYATAAGGQQFAHMQTAPSGYPVAGAHHPSYATAAGGQQFTTGPGMQTAAPPQGQITLRVSMTPAQGQNAGNPPPYDGHSQSITTTASQPQAAPAATTTAPQAPTPHAPAPQPPAPQLPVPQAAAPQAPAPQAPALQIPAPQAPAPVAASTQQNTDKGEKKEKKEKKDKKEKKEKGKGDKHGSDSESSSDSDDGENSGVVSEQRVTKFILLDQKIREIEQTNVQAAFKLKQQEAERLAAVVLSLQKKVSAATAKCAKEKSDVDTVMRANGNASALYALGLGDITKEQQEYVAALTELDMAKQELDNTQRALDAIKVELGPLKENFVKMLDLMDSQECVLDKIFKGSYGSIKENQLEKEVDFHWERQQRIKIARSKWLSSRAYVMEACNQFAAGCKRWTEIPMMQQSTEAEKGPVATQARNYFIAAIQNCNFAQGCLSTIRFPYCHASDLATLDMAIKNVYLDIRMPARHHQVYNSCYLAMYNRSVGLLRWFDQVIAGTIEKDYRDATTLVSQKTRELRDERVRLMIEQLQRQGYTGPLPSLTIQEPPKASQQPAATQQETPVAAATPIMVHDENDKPVATPVADLDHAPPPLLAPQPSAVANTPDAVVEAQAAAPMPSGVETEAAGGGPIPLDKLAPPPSKEDLFGDVQELFAKHAEDMKEIERINDVNRARQEQDLADKLASRRSRKMRKMEQMQAAGIAPQA